MSFLKRLRQHDEPQEQPCPKLSDAGPDGDADALPRVRAGTSTRPTTRPTPRPRPTGSLPGPRGSGARRAARQSDTQRDAASSTDPTIAATAPSALNAREPLAQQRERERDRDDREQRPQDGATDRSPSRVAAV